ncbi:MAG TPA: hypothetical protein VKX45_00170 [Bryobacteraceae bacterium]|jgi:hypothetical protein|nr:hypothetical protein [Bryobacteraceae bacterium]
MSPISGLTNNHYAQSIVGAALQGAGLNVYSASSTATASQPDGQQLSPFARLMSTLQQLQQADPSKYQQVTAQIAANLQNAAQTAQANGNAEAAGELTQLATDFRNASQNNELPNMQDLAQAIGGQHHHGHHAHVAAADADDSTSTSQPLSQLLAAFQANSAQSGASDPLDIITSTLASAGLG